MIFCSSVSLPEDNYELSNVGCHLIRKSRVRSREKRRSLGFHDDVMVGFDDTPVNKQKTIEHGRLWLI